MMYAIAGLLPTWLMDVTPFAIVTWLIVYMFSQFIPKRDREHQAQLDSQLASFRIEMAEERKVTIALKESFERNLKENNQSHADQMCELWERFDRMFSKHDQQLTKTVEQVKEIKKGE